MASPNLIAANTILGKTTGLLLANTTTQIVLNNPSGSGKTLKLNTVIASNKTGAPSYVSLSWNSAASAAGTEFPISANISVPGNSAMTLIDKGTQYYLEENTSLTAYNGTANAIVITASYEDIS